MACCDFNEFLRAMADETRQRILALLREREMSVNEIKKYFPVTQPTISYHLEILRHANLVSSRRSGKQVLYLANPACVAECCDEIMTRFKLCGYSDS